jgi:hypothetical protein
MAGLDPRRLRALPAGEDVSSIVSVSLPVNVFCCHVTTDLLRAFHDNRPLTPLHSNDSDIAPVSRSKPIHVARIAREDLVSRLGQQGD